ncbi:hypothetical protein J4423_00440 [Candidatus Pacearchaeota archaeon]|nr:hypothetical protein [Candidatus Pacearchaeota archaeon]
MNRKEFDIPRLPSLDELIKRAEKEQKEDSCEKKEALEKQVEMQILRNRLESLKRAEIERKNYKRNEVIKEIGGRAVGLGCIVAGAYLIYSGMDNLLFHQSYMKSLVEEDRLNYGFLNMFKVIGGGILIFGGKERLSNS